MYVVMALEMARLDESVPFLAEVVRDVDRRFASEAERALLAIGTREARTALWRAKDSHKSE